MTASMQRFVSIPNRMPDKRQAAERRADFREIFGDYDPSTAAQQSARCSPCGIPYCQLHCPLQNNIPDWLMLAAQGRLEEAYELSSATNNMPEICGRICPHDRLCEGTCVIETAGHGTVAIGAVERFITETAWTEGWVKPPTPSRELDRSVGVIGAGPAGLAAGEQLRRQGYQVHVYDRYDRIGGLSNEVRARLTAARPATLGQAARMEGVTPGALTALLAHVRRTPKGPAHERA